MADTGGGGGGGIRSASMFLTRALEKILADKEMKKSHSAQLKKQCESALAEMKKEAKSNGKQPAEIYVKVDDVEKYFVPFELACKSKSPKVIETALDTIQKLIAHGYLSETSRMSPSSSITKQQLIQRIIKTICGCFEGPSVDDEVQLQIIKCILTILTSPHIEVHEQALLLPVKTCYNIQISSTSLINQASARATLTQIINTVLQRLETTAQARRDKRQREELEVQRRQQQEQQAEKLKRQQQEAASRKERSLSAAILASPSSPRGSILDSTTSGMTTTASASSSQQTLNDPNQLTDAFSQNVNLNDSTLSSQNHYNNNHHQHDEEHYKQIYMDQLRNFECERSQFNLNPSMELFTTIEENSSAISELMCAMLDAVCGVVSGNGDDLSDTRSLDAKLLAGNYEDTFDIASASASSSNHSQVVHTTSGESMMNGKSSSQQDSGEILGVNRSTSAVMRDPELVGLDDPYELDTFLMFRSFCKLSLRAIEQEANLVSSSSSTDLKNNIDVRSKILSLQLILATLQNAKQTFKQSKHIVNAIRRYLCVSLSKNGVSPILEVFELSLAIFVALLADFKHHLKKQIEVFFREIVIFLLETPTSSFDHKWLVIQALTHVCANAQCVVDLYINYDCDLQSFNLFARLVNILGKKALGVKKPGDLASTEIQLRSIRLKGLECLVSILRCMVEWSKDLYVNPNSLQSNLGPENQPQIDTEHLDMASSNKLAASVAIMSGGGFNNAYGSQNSLNSTNSASTSGIHSNLTTSINGSSHITEQLTGSYNPNDFEMLKSKKELWEKGIDLFNKKPKKGLQFLQDNELLGRSPEDVAMFFLEDSRLDKTAIGDYLGENEKLNKEIMYAYVDQIDFYGMEIVPALRLFLEGFRLPGEAQKIDRLMEKFAARYHELNKKFATSSSSTASEETDDEKQRVSNKSNKRQIKNYYFESADAVYVLAFSAIMLATDLHSSSVKKKMTKEEYINMNRGINDNKDLPREFLESIYGQIAESEIKVKGGAASGTTGGSSNVAGVGARPKAPDNEKQRKLLYNMEIEQVTQTARSLMETVCHVSYNFTSAKYGEHIMPMFKLAWTPFLAAFSIGLQDSDDPKIVDLCLNGIRYAIRIACIFNLELERDAYMQALARFTLLSSTGPVVEMKPKNIECIKTLITIAHTDGNYLGKSWYEVLKCISQLELIQSIGVHVINNQRTVVNIPHNSHSLPHHSSTASSSSGTNNSSYLIKESSLLSHSSPSQVTTNNSFNNSQNILSTTSYLDAKTLANIQMQIGETVSQSLIVAVDRIFSCSARLDGDAIVEFVRWLCHVSEEELCASPPRMYSLKMIVEISYYNMGRIRLQWTRIWNVLGEHFNKAGCSPNEEVAIFSVDSLRQLSMKFLEKGEFANFRFQKDFLKPFEHIMKRNSSFAIRDMVVQCITQMVKSQTQNIKSGWKNVFGVFHLAASQSDERLITQSFETVNEIVRSHAEKYFTSIIDSFQDAVKCLSEFACNTVSPDISIEAIGLIRHCAVFVAEKPDVFVEQGGDELTKNVPESDLVWMRGWFPILFELSCIINRCKLDVRTRGLTVMFEIIKTYGDTFRPQWWKELFNIVFRIFDNMKLPEAQIEKTEWMTTTCNHALYAIVDVFTQYFEIISYFLTEDLYFHLKWCIRQDNEQLARSGTNCLENFVVSNGFKFNEDIWRKTCSTLSEIFHFTIPYSLLTWRPPSQSDPATTTASLNDSHTDSVFEPNDGSDLNNHVPPSTPTLKSQRGERTFSTTSVSNETTATNSKIPRSRVPLDMEHKVFQSLLIKCVVHLELIQTIDSIVFYPTTSKKEDANYIAAAQALSSPTSQSATSLFIQEQIYQDEYGMYSHLSSEQLFLLVDCLEESYEFARKFNSNHEQRNLLWKAGFKGKDKPNLLKHETQSLACMLRILFKMLGDETRKDFLPRTQERLVRISSSSIQYYTTLTSESHRESWDNIMLLMLTKIYKLDVVKFKYFSSVLYRHLCDILTYNLKPELRNILRELFVQIGHVNSIPVLSNN